MWILMVFLTFSANHELLANDIGHYDREAVCMSAGEAWVKKNSGEGTEAAYSCTQEQEKEGYQKEAL